MVVIVWYTTHLSRKAISTALVSGGDGQMAEMATDPDVAELLRQGAGAPVGHGPESMHARCLSSSQAPALRPYSRPGGASGWPRRPSMLCQPNLCICWAHPLRLRAPPTPSVWPALGRSSVPWLRTDTPALVGPPPALCRVNSSDMAAAAEHAGTPLGSGRAALQHHSIFSSGQGTGSPRDGFALELAAVLGGRGGRASGGGTPQHAALAAEQQQLLSKKHTPAPPAEPVQLLEKLPPEAGGASTAAAAGPSRPHLRASYTGGGSGGGSSSATPSSVSPLGLMTAARNRLSSLAAV